MFLGRDQERLAIDRLLAEARDGRSGVLALVGEPGIGKTALLEYAIAAAGPSMRVLRARGVESEAAVPFAGLAELLRPALGSIDSIPEPQSAALASALALAPARAHDRFATGAATLSLLSAYAESGPVLVIADDAHRLDAASADALLFAARRLVADPVAVLVAARAGEPSLLDGSDLRALHLGGLTRAEATELLAQAGVASAAAERLHEATGGNPLALIELAPEAARLVAEPAGAPLAVSASISDSFLRRFAELGEPSRRLLTLSAAADSGELSLLARAAAELGLQIEDLAPAEEAGLVELSRGSAEFRHPLARSAIYADASPAERRAAHTALAHALPDRDVDRRAWHLASAALGPDDRVAAALEQAGARARGRSAYAVAATAFERAAALSSTDTARSGLLFSAAEAAWLGGDGDRTLALLDAAADVVDDPRLAALCSQLRARVALRHGPISVGYRLLLSTGADVAERDPDLAAEMLLEAAYGGFYAGDTEAMRTAARLSEPLGASNGSNRATAFAAVTQGLALVADGRGESGADAIRRAVAVFEQADDLRDDPQLLLWISIAPLWLREAGAGRRLLDEAFERARGLAAVGLLPGLLAHLAHDQATTDQWRAAESSFDEAIRLARETNQRAALAVAFAGLARLEARQGRADPCREHAREGHALAESLGMGTYRVWTIQALGDLELALGRPEAAAEHYLAQARALDELGIADVDLSPAPELVELHLRQGHREPAAAAAADFVRRAEEKGQPWALARAARCRGLLADPGDVEPAFREALALHARTPDVFEMARTRLAFGARLRRTRRRVDARAELRAALDTFERLGAEAWAEQAAAELSASGERARRRDPSTLDDLTPQELQIARLLAAGKTTREAAAAVFLSPKTVEYHLRHVYQKLGIRSRDELARRINGPAARN